MCPVDGCRHAELPLPATRLGSTPRRSASSGRRPLPCQSNTATELPLKNSKSGKKKSYAQKKICPDSLTAVPRFN